RRRDPGRAGPGQLRRHGTARPARAVHGRAGRRVGATLRTRGRPPRRSRLAAKGVAQGGSAPKARVGRAEAQGGSAPKGRVGRVEAQGGSAPKARVGRVEAMSVIKQARRARMASTVLATAPRNVKDATLEAMADALLAGTREIVAANA